ncbi:hypothetical protein [Streptomyces sp. NBC_01601]|uniref:hypothetical protein n=1 Tax=Streptomyces sp. NBC_01601 TaxID=2975892 RepID=UPI002E2B6AFE|nr:hypothetical protein [Streptomyces sp. NBC_01601]
MTEEHYGPRPYGWARRHDRVREVMGRLSTDATLAGAWPELDDLGQYGTRRLLDAYDRADTARQQRQRRYRDAVTELEKALWAAARDARVRGNTRPLDILTHAQVREGTPE